MIKKISILLSFLAMISSPCHAAKGGDLPADMGQGLPSFAKGAISSAASVCLIESAVNPEFFRRPGRLVFCLPVILIALYLNAKELMGEADSNYWTGF